MFKYLVSTLLCFFGSAISCFSQEVPREIVLPYVTVSPAAAYVGCGNLHLLLKDFESALDDYGKASLCAELNDMQTAYLVEFFVLFGRIIAYDNLNMRDKAEQALGSLLLLKSSDEEWDDDEDDDDEESLEFYNELHQMMVRMANLSPSEDIRGFLLSIIEDDKTDGKEKI